MKRSVQEPPPEFNPYPVIEIKELTGHILLSQLHKHKLSKRYEYEQLHEQKTVCRAFLHAIDDHVKKHIRDLSKTITAKLSVEKLTSFTGITKFRPYKLGCPDLVRGNVVFCNWSIHYLQEKVDGILPIFRNLTELDLSRSSDIVEGLHLSLLTNLTTLNLSYTNSVQEETVSHLTQLKKLTLHSNSTISDKTLSLLTGLTSLTLDRNKLITDYGVSYLTLLTTLSLFSNRTITDTGISTLTNLKKIYLGNNTVITDLTLKRLTQIDSLYINSDSPITSTTIVNMPNLRTFNKCDMDMTNEEIKLMTNLTLLNQWACDHNHVTYEGIGNLHQLTRVRLLDKGVIPPNALINLTKLKHLSITNSSYEYKHIAHLASSLESLFTNTSFTVEELSHFTTLKTLNFHDSCMRDSDPEENPIKRLTNLRKMTCHYSGYLRESHLQDMKNLRDFRPGSDSWDSIEGTDLEKFLKKRAIRVYNIF